jgi:hypothetical protein
MRSFPPADVPPRPSALDRVLSRTRHPSFSAVVAENLVRALSRRQLLQVWDETTTLLGQPLAVELRLNVVMLRDHLLRRLDVVDLSTGRPS